MHIRYWMMRPLRDPRYEGRGGFIYVLRSDTGARKIGVSCNPNRRIAELRTASAFALAFEYIGALNCDGFAIEDDAHKILDRYHMAGDWFSCSLEVAIGAISVAAHRRGHPIASVDIARVDEIVAAVTVSNARSIKNVLAWCYCIVLMGIIGVAVIALIMERA
jgi:hypothetical protein